MKQRPVRVFRCWRSRESLGPCGAQMVLWQLIKRSEPRPSEGVKKSKPRKIATFPQPEASWEALQRVLTVRLMVSYPPTRSCCRFPAFFHTISGSGPYHLSNTPPTHGHHIFDQHRLLHHKRLPIFDAHQIAVIPRDRAEALADLALFGKQVTSFRQRAKLRAVTQQCRHTPFKLSRDIHHK